MKLLFAGGVANFIIAGLHIIGLFFMDWMFEVTGIQAEMERLGALNPWYPTLLTLFVTVCFTLFGLYAFSAIGRFRRLPFTRIVVYAIAGIYLLRGVGEFFYDQLNDTNDLLETIYSLLAIVIGLMYFFGARQVYQQSTLKLES